MSLAEVVTGDDVSLVITLLSDGTTFNMSGNAVKAMLVSKDRLTAFTSEVTQNEAAAGANYLVSRVAIQMTAVQTENINYQGFGFIEVQVTFPGAKKTWFHPVQIVKGNIT